jgi:hypothetical protein
MGSVKKTRSGKAHPLSGLIARTAVRILREGPLHRKLSTVLAGVDVATLSPLERRVYDDVKQVLEGPLTLDGKGKARAAKECVLICLDLVTMHVEIAPEREQYLREKLPTAPDIASLIPGLRPVTSFRDWFEAECPIAYAERMRAVSDATIATALAAWRHGRGSKARKTRAEPKKMEAVVTLLVKLGIGATPGTLAKDWTEIVKAGRTHRMRDHEGWFRSYGAKTSASAR